MNPNKCPLYAGLSEAHLSVDQYDIGKGIVLSRTFAHLMAPFLMAFAQPEPGSPHPGPWSPVKGGMGFDIYIQLYIPEDLVIDNWFDRINTIWWIVALIRLRASPIVFVPVISNEPYASIPSLKEQAHIWPIEIYPQKLMPVKSPKTSIDENDLAWIRDNWLQGGMLMNKNSDFNTAFQAFDNVFKSQKPSVALMTLWGALEQLFSPAKQELRFRVSATIASYLEPPGPKRLALHKRIVELYDARSKVAHGTEDEGMEPLFETYALMNQVLLKIIKEGHVPTKAQLEELLFGC